jgi:hypothetical protein
VNTRPFAVVLSLTLFCGAVAATVVAEEQNSASEVTDQPAVQMKGYDTAREITFSGAIQEVVTKHIPGSPAGLHLLVGNSGGIIDTHVGPYLPKDVQEQLRTGEPVQVTGMIETFQGKDYLLARVLVVGGRQITVRNEHGFLVRLQSPAHSQQSRNELNGGNQ